MCGVQEKAAVDQLNQIVSTIEMAPNVIESKRNDRVMKSHQRITMGNVYDSSLFSPFQDSH